MESSRSPLVRDDIDWHALHRGQALAALESDGVVGLSTDEARRRLERFGPNAIRASRRRSALSVFFGQFRSPLIYLLFVATGIALALGHRSDAAVILIVVLLNALIGAFQEGRAERSLEALRRLATPSARVVRGGSEIIVETQDVVPGDVLVLQAGDAVAADARLLDGAALQVSEAALTGESIPVGKDVHPRAPETLLADRRNMVYAGTLVTTGRARALVVGTGSATEIGAIAAMAERAAEPKTPLERRIARFGRIVVLLALAMFALINAIGLLRGVPFGEILIVGISQLVGMIPEGLPVAMTIALAIGVQRMARRKAVVRRLAAVETLGSTSVICSDKTGTLTRNEMTVTAVHLPIGRQLSVTGSGYEPAGAFRQAERDIEPTSDEDLRALLEAGVLCNDAQLDRPSEADPRWRPIGDPTEVALLTLAMKGGIDPFELRARHPRLAEFPFDAGYKMMATQHEARGGPRLVVKGAPEVVLELCGSSFRAGVSAPMDEEDRRAMRAAADRMASEALRVLAIAVVPDGAELDHRAGFAGLRDRATLLGLVGQLDPPRQEAQQAVERCRAAGIKPVMVTGDHASTGSAIAAALGIAREGDMVVDGRELEQMSEATLDDCLPRISVFARVHPAQKLRIVGAYQRQGEVVAMTGDGVNDAPALAQADVGVAMGIAGTEVAKEAAKIIIADDNFATIIAAVEEGRIVYRNIKKAVLLLLSTSAAEVLVLTVAMLLGYPVPLMAVQILWNNLVTEGLITVNLIMEPSEGDEMAQAPIDADEPLLDRLVVARMAFMIPAIVISTLGWFVARTMAGVPEAQVRTEIFTLLAICEWFNVLNCRSERKSALTVDLMRNPWLLGGLVLGNLLQAAVVFWAPLGRVFHTVPFGAGEVVALAIVGSLVLWVEELRKLLVRRRSRARNLLGQAG